MKKLTWVLAAMLAFAACDSSTKTEDAAADDVNMEEAAAQVASGPTDPVCDMVKDETWTLYSVSGTDTTWFCSETCKEVFDKNPAKYSDKAKS